MERGTVDTFSDMVAAFALKITEVKQLFMARVEGRAENIYASEMQDLERHVETLENTMSSMQAFIKKESAEIDKVRSLQQTAILQKRHLEFIERRLPSELPQLQSRPMSPQESQRSCAWNPVPLDAEETVVDSIRPDNPEISVARSRTKIKGSKCREHITQTDLDNLSSYMRGRLTVERVNGAIDEIVEKAEANAKLRTAVKNRSSMSSAEREHGMFVLQRISKNEGVQGKLFFLETDLKKGIHVTLDLTGRSILFVLRHLGKLSEVRVNIDDKARVVYVLQ